jgi:hypothetical protein
VHGLAGRGEHERGDAAGDCTKHRMVGGGNGPAVGCRRGTAGAGVCRREKIGRIEQRLRLDRIGGQARPASGGGEILEESGLAARHQRQAHRG